MSWWCDAASLLLYLLLCFEQSQPGWLAESSSFCSSWLRNQRTVCNECVEKETILYYYYALVKQAKVWLLLLWSGAYRTDRYGSIFDKKVREKCKQNDEKKESKEEEMDILEKTRWRQVGFKFWVFSDLFLFLLMDQVALLMP